MTILVIKIEQHLITAKILNIISNKEDNLPDPFKIAVPFAYKVTQVPRTPEPIINIIEQGNESI